MTNNLDQQFDDNETITLEEWIGKENIEKYYSLAAESFQKFDSKLHNNPNFPTQAPKFLLFISNK